MDFFTDASLNNEKRIAGIGCVCVEGKNAETSEFSTFFKMDNIHFAELYALAFAVQKAAASGVRSARIVSDSVSALNNLHHYVEAISAVRARNMTQEQKQFLRIIDASQVQKTALDSIMEVLMTSGISFKFVHVNGHLKTAQVGSDGYWNKRADRTAKKARAYAESSDENIVIPEAKEILKDFPNVGVLENWRDRVQVPYVQAKPKDKQSPKKVSHRQKFDDDACNVCVKLNLRIKVRS